MKHILTLAAAVAVAHTSTAAYFADEVISYTPGTGAGAHTDPSTVLGAPDPVVSPGTPWARVLNPFSPHWDTSQIVRIGAGGQLTLKLSNFVTIDRGPGVFEIGVWEGVFLYDTSYPNGQAGDPAVAVGAGSAVVDVSEDGVHWFSLNNSQPILFELPGNYFTNSQSNDPEAPASPQFADFGKPFTGSVSDFDGKNYSQILATLDGSAGGTWLNLDDAPFERVGYIRFRDVPQVSGTETLELDAVAINTSLAGAPVPEPSSGILALIGIAVIGAFRRKRP